MRILTVCGMGLGTGLLLRMNTEAALARIGVDDAQVEVADIATAKGMGAGYDIVLTSSELAEQLGSVQGRLHHHSQLHRQGGDRIEAARGAQPAGR